MLKDIWTDEDTERFLKLQRKQREIDKEEAAARKKYGTPLPEEIRRDLIRKRGRITREA